MDLIYCCNCRKKVEAQKVTGETVYANRADLHTKEFHQCPECSLFVGCHPDGRPLGTIPSPEIKQIRIRVHAILDPIWKTGLISRGKLYAILTKEFGLKRYHTGEINTLEFGERIIDFLRKRFPNVKPEIVVTEDERELLRTISKIESEKRKNRVEPRHALFIRDILPRMTEKSRNTIKLALNSLILKGLITWGHTINDLHFERNMQL